MKDHVREERWFTISGTVAEFVQQIERLAAGLEGPCVEQVGWDDDCFAVVGWRPMNEAELVRAQARREASRKAAEKRKAEIEAKERALLASLKTKYGVAE